MPGDWAQEAHPNALWDMLNNRQVVIRSEANDRYLLSGCLGDCRGPWDDAWRCVFGAASTGEADRFILQNDGAGFYLVSIRTKVPLMIADIQSSWRMITQRNNDKTWWKPFQLRFVPFSVLDDVTSAVQKDGNVKVRLHLLAVTNESGQVNDRVKNGSFNGYEIITNLYPDTAERLQFEALSPGYRSLVPYREDPNYNLKAEMVFVIETLTPPDVSEWLANDFNKFSCCRGESGARQKTSCVDPITGINYGTARRNCDDEIAAMSLKYPDRPEFSCFQLQRKIEEDEDLRDLAPPVGCMYVCRDKYMTQAMRDAAQKCGPACLQIIRINIGASAKDLMQRCTVENKGGTPDTGKSEIDDKGQVVPPAPPKPSKPTDTSDSGAGTKTGGGGGWIDSITKKGQWPYVALIVIALLSIGYTAWKRRTQQNTQQDIRFAPEIETQRYQTFGLAPAAPSPLPPPAEVERGRYALPSTAYETASRLPQPAAPSYPAPSAASAFAPTLAETGSSPPTYYSGAPSTLIPPPPTRAPVATGNYYPASRGAPPSLSSSRPL